MLAVRKLSKARAATRNLDLKKKKLFREKLSKNNPAKIKLTECLRHPVGGVDQTNRICRVTVSPARYGEFCTCERASVSLP